MSLWLQKNPDKTVIKRGIQNCKMKKMSNYLFPKILSHRGCTCFDIPLQNNIQNLYDFGVRKCVARFGVILNPYDKGIVITPIFGQKISF